jgi:hypothetical protein
VRTPTAALGRRLERSSRRYVPCRVAARLIALGGLISLALTACGGSSSGGSTGARLTSPSTSSPVASSSATTGTSASVPSTASTTVSSPATSASRSSSPTTTARAAAPPGCGQFCQQAGYTAGDADGYPCPSSGCLDCPPGDCVTVLSTSASASQGVFAVRITCSLSTACQGAFLLCDGAHYSFCGPGQTSSTQPWGGRIAAADFVIPPRTTTNVPVALTEVGSQLAAQEGGFNASFLVNLQNYGNPTGNRTNPFLITSTAKPPPLPAGAIAGCGGRVFVASGTSCPFAQAVQRAYGVGNSWDRSPKDLRVASPVTGQTYSVRCVAGAPRVCRADTGAVVYLY